MRVAVLANDVVPGMGLPVAAPGLRAWGLGLGLRAHGHDVTLVVDERVARKAWSTRQLQVPVPQPPGCRVMPTAQVTEFVRSQRIDVLVVTNSNHVGDLGDLGSCRLVYDFFAPKMLELAEQAAPDSREKQLARLEKRKLAALARSDAVIVNGAKKLAYVHEWLGRAGNSEAPVRVTNMALPPTVGVPLTEGPRQAIVSGYLQPWSRLGSWTHAIRPLLDEGSMRLHVLVGSHWGGGSGGPERPSELAELERHPAVVTHPVMRFHDFRDLLSRCHVSIDVFERNPERELAMVTRSAVALSCGVPVMHVPFTEVSEFIREYDAGWLVDEDNILEMERALRSVVDDPAELGRRRDGALRVADHVLEPAVATRGLHELLVGLR